MTSSMATRPQHSSFHGSRTTKHRAKSETREIKKQTLEKLLSPFNNLQSLTFLSQVGATGTQAPPILRRAVELSPQVGGQEVLDHKDTLLPPLTVLGAHQPGAHTHA